MVARVTLAEVDVVRQSLGRLVEVYKQSVMPAQHAQEAMRAVMSSPPRRARRW